MNFDRRLFLKSMGGVLVLSLADAPKLIASGQFPLPDSATPINVIIPRNYAPPVDYEDNRYQYRLTRATLDFLQEHFSNQYMPVWGEPFNRVDLEKRLSNIVYWVVRAVKEHQNIYPLDPVWIIAQIMKESYFYEFAVSDSLAMGICQFIQPTAREYDMLCAGAQEAHRRSPYQLTHFAGKADEYFRLRRERNNFRQTRRPPREFSLEEALEIIQRNKAKKHRKEAGEYLGYLKDLEEFAKKMQQASEDFKAYLEANVAGRDIFNESDLQFIINFDERLTYRKPIFSMTKMITGALKARNGNILAAAAGYNAGLSTTLDEGMYKPYGKIPANEQATTYLSHVLINHYEITRRMG